MLTRRVSYYDNRTKTHTTVLEEMELEFVREVLTGEYGKVNNEERRNKLQNICDAINSCADKWHQRNVESFAWNPRKENRFINESEDIWLMLIGCTDGTHTGILEDEWFLYYFKGFTVQLNFKQQANTNGLRFKLETVNTANAARIGVDEFNLVLHANNISKDEYFFVLKQALYSYAIYCFATNPSEHYML
ncbi:hypothetical protein FACS1894185_1990 [Betaproteobacteria bacterium]|nr:hypothetical protein FACS1894185_1990 [Betaproteobacteria bacterium]